MDMRKTKEMLEYAERCAMMNHRPTHNDMKDCQYWQGEERRRCRTSTNKTCRKCGFYKPTAISQLKTLAEDNIALIEKKKQLGEENAVLKQQIKEMQLVIDELEVELKEKA